MCTCVFINSSACGNLCVNFDDFMQTLANALVELSTGDTTLQSFSSTHIYTTADV